MVDVVPTTDGAIVRELVAGSQVWQTASIAKSLTHRNGKIYECSSRAVRWAWGLPLAEHLPISLDVLKPHFRNLLRYQT